MFPATVVMAAAATTRCKVLASDGPVAPLSRQPTEARGTGRSHLGATAGASWASSANEQHRFVTSCLGKETESAQAEAQVSRRTPPGATKNKAMELVWRWTKLSNRPATDL